MQNVQQKYHCTCSFCNPKVMSLGGRQENKEFIRQRGLTCAAGIKLFSKSQARCTDCKYHCIDITCVMGYGEHTCPEFGERSEKRVSCDHLACNRDGCCERLISKRKGKGVSFPEREVSWLHQIWKGTILPLRNLLFSYKKVAIDLRISLQNYLEML